MIWLLQQKILLRVFTACIEKIPHTPTDIAKVINNAKVSDHHALLPTEQITSYDLSSLPTAEYNICLCLPSDFVLQPARTMNIILMLLN